MLASRAVSLDVASLGASRQAELVRRRQLSPVELVRTYLERIDRLDGRLRAYITVCRETAMEAARHAEEAVTRGGALGPLHGVAFTVKDQFATRGVRTTAGSRILSDNVPDEDATVVGRLTAAGGVLLGKLNLTEFALGGTIRFPFGQPRNPWNTEHDTGGSSAGSGVAVAAALCSVSLGDDPREHVDAERLAQVVERSVPQRAAPSRSPSPSRCRWATAPRPSRRRSTVASGAPPGHAERWGSGGHVGAPNSN